LIRILLIVIFTVVLAGCWVVPDVGSAESAGFDWSSVTSHDEERATARAQSIDRSTFDAAWKTLREFAYTQDRLVVVRDERGDIVGRATKSISVSGTPNARSRRIVSSDSSGFFERSFWSRFSEADSADSNEWPKLLLPEDPIFLATQGPAYFRYAPLPDTTIGGQVINVILTEARPETSRHGIQRAKMYLHQDSLVGLEVVFLQQSMLYRELSNSRIVLVHPNENDWVPGLLRIQSTVGLPFKRARTYELRSDFGNFRPL
jgi:hypothetical protein